MRFKDYITEKKAGIGKFKIEYNQKITLTAKIDLSPLSPSIQYRLKEKSKVFKEIVIGEGDYIFIEDYLSGEQYKIVGDKKTLSSLFKITFRGSGGMGTPPKELTQMLIMEKYQNGKDYSEESIIKQLDTMGDSSNWYRRSYYLRGLESLKYFKSIGLKGKYSFEIPGFSDENIRLFKSLASDVGIKGSKSPFQPADIWLFTNKGISSLKNAKVFTPEDLSFLIHQGVETQSIIPISLKNPNDRIKGIKLIDPYQNTKHKIPKMDLESISIGFENRHFSNLIITTVSKAKFSSAAQNKNTSGVISFVVDNVKTGSITSMKSWTDMMNRLEYKYPIYREPATKYGKMFPIITEEFFNLHLDILKKYNKYIRGDVSKINFNDSEFVRDETYRKKFIYQVSMLDLVMNNYQEIMEAAYGYSTKITASSKEVAPHYVIL